MTTVEYMKFAGSQIQDKDGVISIEKLNALGQGGWELVTFTWIDGKVAFAYFMRKSYQSKKTK